MRTFTFTKKKIFALTPYGREKWIIEWLKNIYNEILKNNISNESLYEFYKNYKNILSWFNESIPEKPEINDKRKWIEFVSEGINFHRKKTGIVPKEYDFLPKIITGDTISNAPWKPKIEYKIALDGLRSVFNVGSIFRLCDAAGFQSVILGNTLGKEHHGVLKTSMGAAEWIPQETTESLSKHLLLSKKNKLPVIGIETVENSCNYINFPWSEKGIIVFGNEEYGISEEVLKCCDHFVHLPMVGRKNSINVANAVSVIVFHICSQLIK